MECRFSSSRQRHISWVFGNPSSALSEATISPLPSIAMTSIENFNADAIRARLTELNLKFSGTSQESFKFNDPDGFLVQANGPDYVGHV